MGYRYFVLWLLVLVANYVFMVVRHEGCHALVAWASGVSILEVHVWPPANGNLSWITTGPGMRSPAVVQLQAALPHLVSLGMVFAALYYLGRSGVRGWRRHVVVTGVLFPVLDLAIGVVGYWFFDNDYAFIFGAGDAVVRTVLTLWLLTLIGLASWVLLRRRPRGDGSLLGGAPAHEVRRV
jgi:hypothetical protein